MRKEGDEGAAGSRESRRTSNFTVHGNERKKEWIGGRGAGIHSRQDVERNVERMVLAPR